MSILKEAECMLGALIHNEKKKAGFFADWKGGEKKKNGVTGGEKQKRWKSRVLRSDSSYPNLFGDRKREKALALAELLKRRKRRREGAVVFEEGGK